MNITDLCYVYVYNSSENWWTFVNAHDLNVGDIVMFKNKRSVIENIFSFLKKYDSEPVCLYNEKCQEYLDRVNGIPSQEEKDYAMLIGLLYSGSVYMGNNFPFVRVQHSNKQLLVYLYNALNKSLDMKLDYNSGFIEIHNLGPQNFIYTVANEHKILPLSRTRVTKEQYQIMWDTYWSNMWNPNFSFQKSPNTFSPVYNVTPQMYTVLRHWSTIVEQPLYVVPSKSGILVSQFNLDNVPHPLIKLRTYLITFKNDPNDPNNSNEYDDESYETESEESSESSDESDDESDESDNESEESDDDSSDDESEESDDESEESDDDSSDDESEESDDESEESDDESEESDESSEEETYSSEESSESSDDSSESEEETYSSSDDESEESSDSSARKVDDSFNTVVDESETPKPVETTFVEKRIKLWMDYLNSYRNDAKKCDDLMKKEEKKIVDINQEVNDLLDEQDNKELEDFVKL